MGRTRVNMTPAVVALAAAALGVSGAASAGSITGVAAPATVVVNGPVTITIQGVGPCSSVSVNYNTALPTVSTFPVTRFPFSPPAHTYAGTGRKTILVTATGNCTGRATTMIDVTPAPPPSPPTPAGYTPSSLSRLCALVGCGMISPARLRPSLTSVTPVTVSPGNVIRIEGLFLGEAGGIVRMRLPLPPNVGGALHLEPFRVTRWTPFSVEGTLDGNLSGVLDGDAQIVVLRSDNVLSNAVTVHFIAQRDVVAVPNAFVTVASCGDDAVSRNCLASNDIRGTRYDWSLFGSAAGDPVLPADPTASFSGFHQNYWDDGGCAGMDEYELRLPEGWVIHSFTPRVRSTLNATFRSSVPIAGRRVGSVIVDWGLTGGDAHVFYDGWFLADGPRGISLTR